MNYRQSSLHLEVLLRTYRNTTQQPPMTT